MTEPISPHPTPATTQWAPGTGLAWFLVAVGLILVILGSLSGSTGWHWPESAHDVLVWTIRAPRSVGAWTAGALLGLAGAVAQGLFRNPLADPFLLGSSSGAALAVTLAWVALGAGPVAAVSWLTALGLTGAAFVGALAAVLLSVALARGVQHSLRLLLGGVVVSVVLGAMTSLVALWWPHVLAATQGFMLGNTALLSWRSVLVLGSTWMIALVVAFAASRVLDALTLGNDAARSLGLPMAPARWVLIAVIAACTGSAVAQTGLVAFVGLAAPHVVRSVCPVTHTRLVVLSSLVGGCLLLGADVAARLVMAPLELPVGVLTALLGGGYLLWRLQRTPVQAA
jgi:iron complex transport system permease protein